VIRGVFSDTHIPFQHPNYLTFLKDTFAEWGVEEVICLGDLIDNHAISRFQSEPCADGAYLELAKAREAVKELTEAFPNVKMCRGNHDDIAYRQAKTLGIGDVFIKPFREIYGLPPTWELEDEYVIDGVLYTHGTGRGGKHATYNIAVDERMSVCSGHTHTGGGVNYIANKTETIFALNTGWLGDDRAYAFEYSRHAKHRGVLGAGVVVSPHEAYFIPMTDKYLQTS